MKKVLRTSIKVVLSFALLCVMLLTFLLFTSPGNKTLTVLANKYVDGLEITLDDGRLLGNSPFDIRYHSDMLRVDAQALQLDVTYFGCDGICIANIAAQRLSVVLPSESSNTQAPKSQPKKEPQRASSAVNLPKITISRVAIARIEVNAQGNILTADELYTEITTASHSVYVPVLTVAKLTTELADSPKQQRKFEALPLLPNIELKLGLGAMAPDIKIAEIEVIQGSTSHRIIASQLGLALQNDRVNVTDLALNYQLPDKPTPIALNMNASLALFAQNDLDLSAQVTGFGEQLDLTFTGSLSKLKFNVTNKGQYSAALQGDVQMRTEHWPFNLEASQSLWQWQTNSHEMSVRDAQLVASGSTQDYLIELQAHSQLGAYPEVASTLTARGNLHSLTISPAAITARNSSARVQADISWQDQLLINFDAQLKQLHSEYFTDAISSDLSGNIAGTFSMSQRQWLVDIKPSQIEGMLDGVEFAFAADLHVDNSLQTRINQLRVKQGDNLIDIQGEVGEQWQLDGKLALVKESPVLGVMQAQGAATFTVRGDKAAPKLQFDGQFNDISGQFGSMASAVVSLQGQYHDAIDYDLTADFTGLDVQGQYLDTISLRSRGDQSVQQVSANVVSPIGELETALVSEVGEQNQAVKVRLEQLDVSIQHQDIALTNATTFNFDVDKQTLSFERICLQGNSLDLCVEPSLLSQRQGELNAQLNHFYLDVLSPLIQGPAKFKGTASGHAKLQWQDKNALSVDVALMTDGLETTLIQAQQQLKYPIEELQLTLLGDANNANANLSISSSVLGQIDANMQVADVMKEQNLQGKVLVTGVTLDKYLNLVPQLKVLQGQLAADIDISGTLTQPAITGKADASGISVEGEGVPLSLVNSELSTTLDNDRIALDGKLLTPDGGELSLTGSGVWLGPDPTLDLTIKGERFTLVPQQSVTVAFSPNMQIKLDANKVSVQGEVEVPYARVKIKELPKGAVKVSDDEVIVDAPVEQVSVPFSYDAKINVKVTDDVYIDSFGLRSHVRGDLVVTASDQSQPFAVGELQLVEGKYRAFGQDLLIRKGQVGFSGMLTKPYINVRAIRNPDNTANGVIAGIELTGSVEAPELHVFSEPAMDRSEALSYVLNGQPLGDGDGNSDALLTQILLAQGVNRSEGMVSKVGEAFGLSDVSLNSSGSGDDTKVEISGYIAPGIQVKYSVGVFESISEVAVRYQVMQQLYIEATSGLYQTLDVLYRFDVD